MTRYGEEQVHNAMALLKSAGVEHPLMEAQLLMALATGCDRLRVISGLTRPLSDEEIQKFDSYVERRCNREPYAYIRGEQEFYGLDFKVTPATLIPRPETELLVDFCLRRCEFKPNATIYDVGTGTGCIAIAVATNARNVTCKGIEKSLEAADVARSNVRLHRLEDRVSIVHGNMLSDVEPGSADVIVSNPPYIPSDELELLQPEVRNYEPHYALDGGKDGFQFHKALIEGAKKALKQNGWLAIELAIGQAPRLQQLFDKAGFHNIKVDKDFAGIERIVSGQFG